MVGRVRSAAHVARRDPELIVLTVRVWVLLVVMRGVITALPMRRITAHLGAPMQETPTEGLRADQLRYARRAGWAIAKAARITPTNSNCYPQALAGRWLLHRKRIPSTLYYGAAFDDDEGRTLQAHVWLRCGPHIITGGGPVRRRFAPLTWYADNRAERRTTTPPPRTQRVQT